MWGIREKTSPYRCPAPSLLICPPSRVRADLPAERYWDRLNTALDLNRLDEHPNITRAQRQVIWKPGTALTAIQAA